MPLTYNHPIPSADSATSVPRDNPLGGPRPKHFADGEVLTIVYRTDPDAVAALVPHPLVPLTDLVMVQIARWGDVPGSGRDTFEANIMLGAEYRGDGRVVSGAYSPYFYATGDRFIASGREFHGQPKLLADVRLEMRGDLIVGSISRNGIDVFRGTLPYKAQISSLDEVRADIDPVTNLNLKVIPQIDGSPGMRQITARDLANLEVSECWTGPGTAEIAANAQAPLFRLPVLEHRSGFYWRAEFDLVGGTIVYDYTESSKGRDS